MNTDVYPERPDSAVNGREPIESPIPQVLIPEVRQHARRRRLRNLSAVLIAGAAAAGLFIFLGSGSPAGSRASRPSSPFASGATRPESADQVCNKAAPRRVTGQAVLSATRGRYTATVYHPTGSQVFVCLTDGRRGAGGQMSNFGRHGIPKPRPDQLIGLGGGAGAAPGFPGRNPSQPPAQYRDQSSATNQRFRRLLARGVESDVVGMAGRHVSAVTFDFTGGLTVDATVRDGWYFAWWPTLDNPTSVQITTTSGQTRTDECSSPTQSESQLPPC
jgi:hypothetical protein